MPPDHGNGTVRSGSPERRWSRELSSRSKELLGPAKLKPHVAGELRVGLTISHEDTMIEAFILDFDEEIRGREIEVIFHRRLRPEKKFSSHEELSTAIGNDVATVSKYFSERMKRKTRGCNPLPGN